MKKNQLIVASVLLFNFTITSNAFGACENELSEAKDFESKCNTANDATAACAVAAALTSWLHFGLGGLACAAPAATASNLCRIKDEKYGNYNQCIAKAQALEAENAEKERLKAIANKAKLDAEAAFEAQSDALKKEAHDLYLQAIDLYFSSLAENGIDPQNEENKEMVEESLSKIKNTYDLTLVEIEKSRLVQILNLDQPEISPQ